MFTRSVLSCIHDDELKNTLHLGKHDEEPDLGWSSNDIDINKLKPKDIAPEDVGPDPTSGSLQQSDLLRKFYLCIAIHGLQCAHQHAHRFKKPGNLPQHDISKHEERHVIVVGAGISGLVAAYELKRAGYSVQILEMSQRYGGRVKTLTEKDGFDKGLYTEAGAMRLPQTPDKDRPICHTIHYLTDYYAEKKFDLNPIPFTNHSDNAFYNFYGMHTKISDWKDSQFSDYWPGWDTRLKETGQDITNLNTYYAKTVDIVENLLKKRLKGIPSTDLKAQAKQWNLWTNNWCQFSLGSFMRSTLTGIKSQLKFDEIIGEDDPTLNELEKYLPWPEMALTAYAVFNYILSLDISLVAALQSRMGKWGSAEMHSLKGGLSALPNAFAVQGGMEPLITYNRTVMKVEYTWNNTFRKSVRVSGVITSSGQPFSVEGRSVILSVPLHVLRGIQIVNSDPQKKDFPKEFQQAIQDITYLPSTKIMLQYKKQFWNTGMNKSTDITGGFSKTNMPIGQLLYPTEMKVSPGKGGIGDWIAKPVTEDQKGILMVYTWKAEALLWGALEEDQAIMLAVNQIDRVHPDIDTKALFEVGRRQAWTSDPTTLGAFVVLRPREYISVIYLMQNSWRNVYFAGEAISFANGWIQGALESGLRAAYQLFSDDHPRKQKL